MRMPHRVLGTEKLGPAHSKEHPDMSPFRKAVVAVAMVGSTLTGGAIGAALFVGGSANAADHTVDHTGCGQPVGRRPVCGRPGPDRHVPSQ